MKSIQENDETNSEEWSWGNMLREKMEYVSLNKINVQKPARYIDAFGDHIMNMCTEVADVTECFLNSVAEDLASYVTGEGEEAKVAPADPSIEKKRTCMVAEDPSFVSHGHFIIDPFEKSNLDLGNVNEEVVEKQTAILAEETAELKEKDLQGSRDNISSEVNTSLPSSPLLVQDDSSDSPVEHIQVKNEPCRCDSDEVAAVGNTMETAEMPSNNDMVVTNLDIEEFEDVQLEDCMEDSVHGELCMQTTNNRSSYKQKIKNAFASKLQWSHKNKRDVTTPQIGSSDKLDETNSTEQLPQIKDSGDDSDWEVL